MAYPALIYFSIRWAEPRTLALVGIALWVLRSLLTSRGRPLQQLRALAAPSLAVGVPLALAAWSNQPLALLLTPAAVSFGLLAVFGRSLWQSVSLVERFARGLAADLSAEEIAYCRRVTAMWCVFFLANGSATAALALAAARETWVLYTSFISYLLIGALFASEFIYRHWRFRRYTGAPTDFLLRRVFPPRGAQSV
jgi:uncharacterized membrane protein